MDDPLDVLRGWTVQDSPPGAATAALLARVDELPVGWLDEAIYERRTVVALYNARTATAIVPADEAAAYGTALLPTDDAGYKAIVGSALPEHSEGFAEPVALAVAAVSDVLDGVTLSRDELHEGLRQRLPGELLPWCEGCKSHHARRGLLVLAGLHGRLCIAGRAGRQPAFARTDQLVGWEPPEREAAGAELVRRYRRAYGASSVAHFAEWGGLGKAHARELWALADDADEAPGEEGEPASRGVTAGGGAAGGGAAGGDVTGGDASSGSASSGDAGVHGEGTRRTNGRPIDQGVRLLASGDPLLLTRDREALLPDPALRKKVWAASGGAGIVLVDGAPAALWRARKQGKRLDVTVEAFAKVPRTALQAEAERLAPHRGCTSVEVHSGE